MVQTSKVDSGLEVLQQGCERNVPVQLRYARKDSSPSSVEPDTLYAQTRMIGMKESTIYADSPQQIGKKVELMKGTIVEAYFDLEGETYTFQSKVIEIGRSVVLNNQKRIIGMCLSVPKEVKKGHKREDFRVSVASCEVVTVEIHEACKTNTNSAAINAKRFEGKIVNMSRGGLSLYVEGKGRFQIQASCRYFVMFRLPDSQEEMIFLAESRHIKEIPRKEACRIGFQFMRWPSPVELRRNLGEIGPFIAQMERQKLRRNRTR